MSYQLTKKEIPFECSDNLTPILPQLDSLYVTRTQTERSSNTNTLDPLTKASLSKLPKQCSILHPLPRVSELSPDIDTLPNARYFEQSKNGVYIRMALIESLLTP